MTIRQDSLDETDRRLIEALRADSRLPAATLARRLDVSRGTVQNRIDRLVKEGVILGFTLRLAEGAEAGVKAIANLELRGTDHREVARELRRSPEVTRIWSTNGRWDLVIEIAAPSLAALDAVLTRMRGIKSISHSETSILLAEMR